MAKISVINRNKKREKLAKKYSGKRAELLEVIAKNKNTDPSAVFDAYQQLALLPRNSSPTRVWRELASSGQLPGVKKASW
jgi:small subunit ribosomal protein S14